MTFIFAVEEDNKLCLCINVVQFFLFLCNLWVKPEDEVAEIAEL